MTNVLEMLLAGSDHVVIDGGLISEFFVHSDLGCQRVVNDPPVMTYFVTLHEADGGEICLWDGVSYASARETALEISVDWGRCAIVDKIPGVST